MESSIARLRVALARKPALAAAAGAAALVAILIALLLRRDSRIALYASPLRPEQVAEVAQTLSSWNAPYLVEGDSIRVDAGRRNDLLLRLSLAGVPHAHVETRSEALAKASALTPQSVIDSEQLEGLAGEIALGLRGVAGIRDAHVIIAPARPPTFADETAHEASASVRLSLDPGTKLQARTLLGIRAFVAAGVAGLDAARVALLDDRGATLGDDESGPAPSERDGLEASLQSALDTAFGAGATIVRVHARSTQLSVAIAVDSARTLDLAKIRSLAAATLGIDVQRGDALDVEEVAFTAAAAQAPSSAATVIAGLAAVLPPVLC